MKIGTTLNYSFVCMHACVYSYQPEGWLDPHTVPAPDTCVRTHMHSTPHTTIARRTKSGVKWGRVASSFPPLHCTQPGNDEMHYLAKVGSTKFDILPPPTSWQN